MITINQSISISGNSIIHNGEKDIIAAYINANIGSDGNISINKSINDKEIFHCKEEEILKDLNEFEAYVYKTARELKEKKDVIS